MASFELCRQKREPRFSADLHKVITMINPSQLKIATPVSTILNATARLAEILELSDVLEMRELSRPVASSLPRIYHCDWSLIEPWTERELQEITNIILNSQPRLATFHLHACYPRPPLEDGMFQARGRKMSAEEMIQNARVNKANLEQKLGRTISMAVENNNFYPTGAYETVTEGKFINVLMAKLDCKLLLDVAHAQITAVNQKISLEKYLGSLDLSRAVQFHLSHPDRDQKDPALARDFHEALQDDDWTLVKNLIPRCPNLEYLTLEYYKDDSHLVAMLKKLREILEK